MSPLVSIVIPTFDNAGLISETLDGITRQTFEDFEIILVDDGSTDNTAEVVREYRPAIIYAYQPNKGPAAARNRGVDLARGEYVAFCDHDDVWNNSHLEELLKCFSRHPGITLAFDNTEFFGDTVAPGKFHVRPERPRFKKASNVTAKDLLLRNPIASMSNIMVAKEAIMSLGGFSEGVGIFDDLHFYLRLASCRILRYVDYVGVKKRIFGSNLCGTVNLKEGNVLFLEDIRQNYPDVVSSIGYLTSRLRLARKYFKLARSYARNREYAAARRMFWRAYTLNCVNPRYLWCAASTWTPEARALSGR